MTPAANLPILPIRSRLLKPFIPGSLSCCWFGASRACAVLGANWMPPEDGRFQARDQDGIVSKIAAEVANRHLGRMGQRQKLQGCKDFSTPGLSLKALRV